MCEESNDKQAKEIHGRIGRAEKLVGHLIAEAETYHSHKETMAHAGLLVMLALLGGVLTANQWPPAWVPTLSLSPRCVAFFGLAFTWFLLHIYVRSQLRYKRAAAITQAAAFRALAEWVAREPSGDDVQRYAPEKEQSTSTGAVSARKARLLDYLDYVFPFPRASLHYDFGEKNFPKWLGDALKKQEEDRTGAIKGEWLVTIGSFFILLVTAARALL